MRIVDKIRTLGFSFVFEIVFERIIPVWMCRFCSLAVYQIDSDKLSGGPFSTAAIKVCDSDQEFEQLKEITSAYGEKNDTIGFLATMEGEIVGGLWVAFGDYLDEDVGLSFLLGREGAWIYSARVDAAYRRRGIYSQLMAESVRSRKNTGHAAPFIGVSKLNRGSYKAIQRFGTLVGQVWVLRLGPMVWARAKGDLKQNQSLTMQCTRRPIQISVPEIVCVELSNGTV